MARERKSVQEEYSERASDQEKQTEESVDVSRRDCLRATGISAIAAVGGLSFGTGSVTADDEGGPVNPKDWSLAFEDQFDSDSLDSKHWGVGFGWGMEANNDDADVVEDDVYIDADQLVLEVNHHGGGRFTQGVVNTGSSAGVQWDATRAEDGVTVGPGTYIEARIKPATRSGILPAFWTKPDNEDWPPEIDIFEIFHYGNARDSQVAHAELHYSESGQCGDEDTHTAAGMGSYDAGHDLGEEWHVYGCEWQEDEIKFYFDGELYDSTSDPEILDAFNNSGCLPHYLMFSNHVNRLGTADESTTWTEETRVDWCRVWEYTPDEGSVPDEESPETDGTLVHDCSDLDALHPSSDRDQLMIDQSNGQYFKRNDGDCSENNARITRSSSTDAVSMIYEAGGSIIDFRVEAHDHDVYGGSFAFYVSEDGDSWTELTPEETEYCGATAGWRHVEYTAESLPVAARWLRIDLTGGNANWTGQVGHVEIEYGDEKEDTEDEESEEKDDAEDEKGSEDDESDTGGVADPVVDQLSVRWNNNGRWNRARTNWSVSDEGGNLESVTTELLNGYEVLSTETSSVNGSSASGEHQVRSDNDVDAVRVTVVDATGNEDTKRESL